MVNLIIWGIRTGFEGILYNLTPPPSQINSLMRDAFFRAISNLARPSNYYMLNSIDGFCMVTLIYTDIFEHTPTSRREGFVAFTLVLPQNQALLTSPIDTLQALAEFYKAAVGNGDRNNFTDNQIKQILEPLAFDRMPYTENKLSAFTFFEKEQEIASILMCDTPYCNQTELLLLPATLSNRLSISDTHTLLDLDKLEHHHNQEIKRKSDEKAQLEKLQEIARKEEGDIRKRMQTSEMESAYSAWQFSEVKQHFSTALTQDMTAYRQKKEQEEADHQKNQYDAHIVKELLLAIEQAWSDQEIESLYYRIHFKDKIPNKIINFIREIQARRDQVEITRKKEEKRDREKKKRKQTLIIIASISTTISFIGLTYALGWLDSPIPPPTQAITQPPQIDSTENSIKPEVSNPLTKILSKTDSLFVGYAVQVFGSELGILNKKFVVFDTSAKIWYYGPEAKSTDLMVETAHSESKLMNYFGLPEQIPTETDKSSTLKLKPNNERLEVSKTRTPLPPDKKEKLMNILGKKEMSGYNKKKHNEFKREYLNESKTHEMPKDLKKIFDMETTEINPNP